MSSSINIREYINDRPILRAAISIGVIAIVIVVWWRAVRGSTAGRELTQAYYSDDDGKTYFADAAANSSPFDHNGKPAYRAFVFKCSATGQLFVGYLVRKEELPPVTIRNTGDAAKAAAGHGKAGGVQVKKPGTGDWIPASSPQAPMVAQPTCPDGGRAMLIFPGT